MITHLACIMDGNRRWAQQNGMMPWYGHSQGAESVKTAIQFCIENSISYLSLYAFSLENFNRSALEKEYIFSYLINEADKQLPDFIAHGVSVRFVGDRSLFPAHVLPVCESIEQATAQGTNLKVQILFCYGARQELLAATKEIGRRVASGEIKAEDISESMLKEHLWTGAIPEPDLIIRTGGFKRLSNFLLYQSAYSELYFTDCLWPEITAQHLHDAMSSYHHYKRNFGT